jgi:hypothetical protein
VSGESGLISITGDWDFGDCTAGGSWFTSDTLSGSWELALE